MKMIQTFRSGNNHGVGKLRPLTVAILTLLAGSALAQSTESGAVAAHTVVITGDKKTVKKPISPATTESVDLDTLADTTNVMNVEDAFKYVPSVLVRKRFTGDTQEPLASRTTGINASARTLIFADDVLLSTLVNNNNGNGSPQWFMVSPEEIDHIDVMYGPFSAAYAGNSYGAVAQITTRMPTKFEATVNVNLATQQVALYGTHDHAKAGELNATLGDRSGALSWFISANHLDSTSQPITFGTLTQSTTVASPAAPVISGAYADFNRTGGAIQVIGGSNFTHTIQDTAKIKLAYDFTPQLTVSYALGFWQNNAKATSGSYLTTATGAPYYGGTSGTVNIGGYSYSASTIAGQYSSSSTQQEHVMQSLSLNSKTYGVWDWEAIATNVNYVQDLTRTSTGVYPAAMSSGAGRIGDASGTGWSTLDIKGIWRPQGVTGEHVVTVGLHDDQYKLVSPTYTTTDWVAGSDGALYTTSLGKTQTKAIWGQDAWRISPALLATLGGRYEYWTAYDGYNYALASSGTGFGVNQPDITHSGLSPKATLRWTINDQLNLISSFGKALRFPTVGELYQNIQTGTTYTQANPNLKPENVLSEELALEYKTGAERYRASLFQEDVTDALISQTATIAGYATPVSYTQNIDKTRQRGIELVAEKNDVLIHGLELTGSVTYVDAVILANSSYVPTIPGATSVGKHTPYVPDWRATAVATYRPDDRWALTLAGRYTGRQYATVDNTDSNGATYQGFQSFFVADFRAHYQINQKWSAAAGIDNLNNKKYYLYHPFPQRTAYAELKYTY